MTDHMSAAEARALHEAPVGLGEPVRPEQPALLTGKERLAPGVAGYTVDLPEGLYIGFIAADKPGNGDVSRYLDSLPRDRRVVVPNVMSDRLAGMLQRRGFIETVEWAEQFGELVPIWQRG